MLRRSLCTGPHPESHSRETRVPKDLSQSLSSPWLFKRSHPGIRPPQECLTSSRNHPLLPHLRLMQHLCSLEWVSFLSIKARQPRAASACQFRPLHRVWLPSHSYLLTLLWWCFHRRSACPAATRTPSSLGPAVSRRLSLTPARGRLLLAPGSQNRGHPSHPCL